MSHYTKLYRDRGGWAGWACRALGGTGAQAWALGRAGARAGERRQTLGVRVCWASGRERGCGRERAQGARQALRAGGRRRRARGAAQQGARGAGS